MVSVLLNGILKPGEDHIPALCKPISHSGMCFSFSKA